MKTEDKELLLQDLCARLPYGVKVLDNSHKNYGMSKLINIGFDGSILIDNEMDDIQYYPLIDDIKPYLRLLSSMTEEEKNDYLNTFKKSIIGTDEEDGRVWTVDSIDWLNVHHFDYRGLIEKGLAIAITEENNPYKD